MSETKRVSWDEVYEMNIYEFFSMLGYIKEKNRRQREAMRKWRQS